MTPRFVAANMDEAYVIISDTLVEKTGKTPYGIPLSVWEAQMSAIREAA